MSAISWTKSYDDLKDIEDIIDIKDDDADSKIQYSKILSDYGFSIMAENEKEFSVAKIIYAQKLFEKANDIFRHTDYISNYGITFAYIAESTSDFNESEKLYLKSFDLLLEAYDAGQYNDLALINYCRAILSYILKINDHGLNEKIGTIEKYKNIAFETFEKIENKWIKDFSPENLQSIIYYSELNYEWSRFLFICSQFDSAGKLALLDASKKRCENVIRKNEIPSANKLLADIEKEISEVK